MPWDELVTHVMPSFDLFVFPTRFDYSPFAVIEAMALGLPVIASGVGSIPEMVEDGVTGFLIEPDNVSNSLIGFPGHGQSAQTPQDGQDKSVQRSLPTRQIGPTRSY